MDHSKHAIPAKACTQKRTHADHLAPSCPPCLPPLWPAHLWRGSLKKGSGGACHSSVHADTGRLKRCALTAVFDPVVWFLMTMPDHLGSKVSHFLTAGLHYLHAFLLSVLLPADHQCLHALMLTAMLTLMLPADPQFLACMPQPSRLKVPCSATTVAAAAAGLREFCWTAGGPRPQPPPFLALGEAKAQCVNLPTPLHLTSKSECSMCACEAESVCGHTLTGCAHRVVTRSQGVRRPGFAAVVLRCTHERLILAEGWVR
eukprot:1159203-Pelagomonas_calceolata.AAC.1